MPPRNSSALQNSFAVSDADNVVVCPLKNHDGSSCRKRCFGEKRYRSMQEHIRRAHPEHYIAKLPATEESFHLMVNTPPSERPQQPHHHATDSSSSSTYLPADHHYVSGSSSPHVRVQSDKAETTTSMNNDPLTLAVGFSGNRGSFNSYDDGYMADSQRSSGEGFRRGSILPLESAAAALAQLHNFRAEGPPPPLQLMSGWDSEQVRDPYFVFTAPPLFDSIDIAPAVAPSPVFTTLATLPPQQYLPTTATTSTPTANGHHMGNGSSNGNSNGATAVAVAASGGDDAEGLIDNTFVHLQEPVYSDGEGGYRKSLGSRKNARFAPLLNDDGDVFDEDQFIHPDLGGVGGQPQLKRELLPSSLARSPPGRSSTLPPGNRPVKPPRPRKRSVGQNAMKPKHERTKSRELQKRYSHERKAYSAEPQAATMGRSRWEDLIDAAASATEEDIRDREDSRDRTPVPQGSPAMFNRSSIPPYLNQHIQSYTASPLARELTPPAQMTDPTGPSTDLIPFPSVESSIDSSLSFSHPSHASNVSGSNFHIPPAGLSDSSPIATNHGGPGVGGAVGAVNSNSNSNSMIHHPVEIYCALCKRPNLLRTTYACDSCICGLCSACVSVLEGDRRRESVGRPSGGGECPVCRSTDSAFKIVRFDIR